MYTRRFATFLLAAHCIAPHSFGEPPTYSEDIAPILERSCQVCHHPGSIGPMSLLTYKEVRPWAKSIRRRVLDKEMPPFGAKYEAIRIPPGASNHVVTKTGVMNPKDILIHDFTGHMHYRGKSLSIEIELPTGEKSTPFYIPRFDFYWQQTYELAKPLLVPGGSKATLTGVFDNSLGNKLNPDPGVWVYGGNRTEDEMLQAYLNYTDPSEQLGLVVQNGIEVAR